MSPLNSFIYGPRYKQACQAACAQPHFSWRPLPLHWYRWSSWPVIWASLTGDPSLFLRLFIPRLPFPDLYRNAPEVAKIPSVLDLDQSNQRSNLFSFTLTVWNGIVKLKCNYDKRYTEKTRRDNRCYTILSSPLSTN